MKLHEVTRAAFMDELTKLSSSLGVVLSAAQADYMYKEARFLQAVRKVLPQSGTQKFLQAAKSEGVGDVAEAALKKSRPSARAEAWGRSLRETPVQRMRADGLGLKPGEAAEITRLTKQMGGTNLGKRMLGGAVEGAGHHVGHKSTLGLAINPLGVPLGGAIEGVTKQVGRELVNTGSKTMGAAGGALQRHAGKAGLAGEIAGLSGLGTALHAPVSGAGALGTGVLKAVGAKGGLVNALGSYGAHGAADALGTAIHSGAGRVAAGPVGRVARKVVGGVAKRLPGLVGSA